MPRITARSQMARYAAAAAGLALAFVAACDSDPTAPVIIATSNVVAPVSSGTVAAVTGKTFSFPSGAALSPTLANQPVSFTFSQTGTTTTAAIQTPTATVPATVTFGSCIFTITATVGGFTQGQVITVPTCNITLNTNGTPTGTTTGVSTTMTLGTTNSNPVTVTVTVAANGTVTVTGANGQTVTVGVATTGTATGTVTGG